MKNLDGLGRDNERIELSSRRASLVMDVHVKAESHWKRDAFGETFSNVESIQFRRTYLDKSSVPECAHLRVPACTACTRSVIMMCRLHRVQTKMAMSGNCTYVRDDARRRGLHKR